MGPGPYRLAVELWGRPQGVAKAMAIHNAAIRDLAKGRDGVAFVDHGPRSTA